MNPRREWRPHGGPQTDFLACSTFEVGFGGAAGPGKSEALLMGALRYVNVPEYSAILFRRTFPELERSLIERSRRYYPWLGGQYNEQKKVWTFPSGARIAFGHLEHDNSVEDHLSAEYQYVGFDECVTFTVKQYKALLGRLRSSSGIPTRIRWASNPADDDKHWLIARYGPWIDTRETYAGYRARPGEVLWFAPEGDGEKIVPKGTPDALPRTYFPARLTDNPTLMRNDPGYAARIAAMGETERKRFLEGDWFARQERGALWEKADFDNHRVSANQVPDLVRVLVAVDPAVTNTPTSDECGIIAGGVSDNGHVYVSEDWSRQGSVFDWGNATIRCFKLVEGNGVVGEVNNGGDLVESNLANIDASIPFKAVHASRGKDKRAEPVATLCKRGRVHIVGALPELESECKRWVPGVSKWSPNRMDAFVWLVYALMPNGVLDDDEPPPPVSEEAKIETAVLKRHEDAIERERHGDTEWTG